MGRRNGENSVTQRFVSFGSSLKGAGGPRKQAMQVEMVERNTPGRTARPVYIATSSLLEFPPLPTPGLPPPAPPKALRAPLFLMDTTGGQGPAASSFNRSNSTTADAAVAGAADSAARSEDVGSNASSREQLPQRARLPIKDLESELGQKEREVKALKRQLEEARAEREMAEKRKSELEDHALLASQELATSLGGMVMSERAAVHQRMAQVHQSALELLASFQQQGYEVAAGLDALQDDLEDVGSVMGEPPQALASHTRASMAGQQEQDSSAEPGPASPTEKMVLLKARREHVETAYLDLVKTCVTGLERLVAMSAPTSARAIMSHPGSAPGPSASASMGDLADAAAAAAGAAGS